jgi:hypothetical protein
MFGILGHHTFSESTERSMTASHWRFGKWVYRCATGLLVAVAIGSTLVAFGSPSSAGAQSPHHTAKRYSLNPNDCPAPSVLESALDIAVLNVTSHTETGVSHVNNCDYLTNVSAPNGHPINTDAVYFNWPTSSSFFGKEIALPTNYPYVRVLGGRALFQNAHGHMTVIALKGNIQIEVGNGGVPTFFPTTKAKIVALANIILDG